MQNAVEIHNLDKEYRLYGNPYHRITDWFTCGRKKSYKSIWALKDVNLTVPKGMTLGIVGENGAGKSTLLKILSGTSFPTRGGFRLNGSVASLLELGSGFSSEFTGRENIYMNAAINGLSHHETKKRVPEIIDFSGLGEFIDAPLRTYSSGMVCRLGFSTAVAVDPDILIIDEILAVGDMEFQEKCVDKISGFRKQGKTIIFCSHAIYDVRQICDQAIWIRHGEIRAHDTAMVVTNEYVTYEKQLAGREMDLLKDLPGEDASGEQVPRIVDVQLLAPNSTKDDEKIKPGDPVAVDIEYANDGPDQEFHVSLGLTRSDTTLCFTSSSRQQAVVARGPRGKVRLHIPRIALLSGEFIIFVWLSNPSGELRFDQSVCKTNLTVINAGKDVGLIKQEHTWQIQDNH